MYTFVIALLIITIPLLVQPQDIKKNKYNPYYCVLRSIIATMLGILIFFVIVRMSGNGLYNIYHKTIVEMVDMIIDNDNLRGMFVASGVSDAVAHKEVLAIYERSLSVVPGIILVVSTIYSYFTYIVLSKSLSKRLNVQLMPKFKDFNFPPTTCMAMVCMYLAALLMTKAELFPNDFIYQNINYLFDFVFLIQGASVIFFYFSFRKWPKFMAVIIVLILWNFLMLKQILVLLGMVDMLLGIKGFIVFKEQRKSGSRDDKNRRNRFK